jgi:hypothetical protein
MPPPGPEFAFFIALAFAAVLAAVYFLVSSDPQPASAGDVLPSITLFSGEDFTGRSLTIAGTCYDMPKEGDGPTAYDWNDEVRSVVVNGGTWRLYQHGRCNTKLDPTRLADFNVRAKEPEGGWSCLLSATSTGPLKIPNTAAAGFFRDVSSLELVSSRNLPDWSMSFRN